MQRGYVYVGYADFFKLKQDRLAQLKQVLKDSINQFQMELKLDQNHLGLIMLTECYDDILRKDDFIAAAQSLSIRLNNLWDFLDLSFDGTERPTDENVTPSRIFKEIMQQKSIEITRKSLQQWQKIVNDELQPKTTVEMKPVKKVPR